MDNSELQELYQVEAEPDLVVRSDKHAHHSETVSFGPVWSVSKYSNALDVVNYYKPVHKNQIYLPENSFINHDGKLKGHMGGESTFRGGSVNNNKEANTQTNNFTFHHTGGEDDPVDSDNDTVVPEGRGKGLFEVPFDVYSMPRLITPFKGFSRIVTPRAVRLMHFTETEEGKLVCKLDKNSLRVLQKQVGDLNVVVVSFVGDPKSGKSFLASLLVGKDNASFNMSESYIDPNNMLTNGAVWAYVAIYHEKHAYVFLDFEGLEHSEKSREKMLLFAFATSNLVFCNVKYSLMTGIHNSVNAMVQLTKKVPVNETLGEEPMDEEETEFLEILKNKGSRLLTRSYDSQNFNELAANDHNPSLDPLDKRDMWNAPIVQFVFRDCSGFVKCIDDRIFTPETLVEQGLFENYLDLFDTSERDPNFRNEMLDSFEVFTNRKYISLPHPILSTHPYSEDYSDSDELNLTEFFVKLLSSDKNDFRRLPRFSYDDFTLNTNLSTIFYEKLDQLKSLLYHDTLNYALAHTQLNGRMLGEYLKKLASNFNSTNSFKVDDLNEVLSSVFLGENTNLLKECLIQFLKHVRAKVAPKLPVDSKSLLNMVLSAKFTSLNNFESNAFGTPEEYKKQLNELSETLEELTKKLENKNKSLMTLQIVSYLERKESAIISKILHNEYSINDLNEDLSRLKKLLNEKFTDSELVTKALATSSQNLVRIFNDTHPETFVHNLSFCKSASIEETFQSLNSDITSIKSNLNMPSKSSGKFPSSVDAYLMPGAEPSEALVVQENDKFDFVLEDNTLVEQHASEQDDSDREFGEYLTVAPSISTGEQQPEAQETQAGTSDTEDPSASEHSTETSTNDEPESAVEEEQKQQPVSDDSDSEDAEFENAPSYQLEVKLPTEAESPPQTQRWDSSDASESTGSDNSTAVNSESAFDETPVRTPVHAESGEQVMMVSEDDFALDDIDDANYNSNSDYESLFMPLSGRGTPKRTKKSNEKHTLLRKIFEKSAEKFIDSRR